MNIERELAHCGLFAGVRAEVMAFLCGSPLVRRAEYENGEILCDRDHRIRGLGMILRGTAVVMLYKDEKSEGQVTEPVLLNRIDEGMVFGYASIFTDGDEYIYSTRVRAAGKTTVLWLAEALLTEAMGMDLTLAVNIMKAQSEKIRLLNRKVAAFTAADTVEKLLLYLEEQADIEGRVSVNNMSALARRLDMGRASLYRAAEQLKQNGKIRWEGKEFCLLPRENNDHEEEIK